ncbi:unnamed protein product [Angiostrongylus costaricensis]|uniref:Uncharacterized protein n=1 Tax=Angiostrongylus costaricensis TaxID=334426 RepID=A0A0R3PIV4_ANGCS|nr:unnamed protein product [Angiostrongylus costaricensis]
MTRRRAVPRTSVIREVGRVERAKLEKLAESAFASTRVWPATSIQSNSKQPERIGLLRLKEEMWINISIDNLRRLRTDIKL